MRRLSPCPSDKRPLRAERPPHARKEGDGRSLKLELEERGGGQQRSRSVQQRHAFLLNVKRRQDRPAAGGCGSVNTRSAQRHLTESAAQVTDAAICRGAWRLACGWRAACGTWQAARAAGAPERRPAVRAPTSARGCGHPAAAASRRSPKCTRASALRTRPLRYPSCGALQKLLSRAGRKYLCVRCEVFEEKKDRGFHRRAPAQRRATDAASQQARCVQRARGARGEARRCSEQERLSASPRPAPVQGAAQDLVVVVREALARAQGAGRRDGVLAVPGQVVSTAAARRGTLRRTRCAGRSALRTRCS
jgi:hypothetical protein